MENIVGTTRKDLVLDREQVNQPIQGLQPVQLFQSVSSSLSPMFFPSYLSFFLSSLCPFFLAVERKLRSGAILAKN